MLITLGTFFKRHRLLSAIMLAALGAATAWAGYRYWHQPPQRKGAPRIEVDLRNPEMRLVTRNLAELPKDVASTPALAGLVDEELVFHYEQDEARLSLEGTVRRLAYEHNLVLEDRFVAALLSAPAEIGIWRSAKGRPEHFVMAVERGMLAKFTEALAKVALNDRQLKQAGKLSVRGKAMPLYAVDYGGGRTMGIIGSGERWVFISNPSLVLDENNEFTADAEQIIGDLLKGQQPWEEKLPHNAAAKHSFTIAKNALTLNYARFLPSLKGLRLDFQDAVWRPQLRLADHAFAPGYDVNARLTSIWQALPANAALCAALPVNWQEAATPLEKLLPDQPALRPTLAALGSVGAVCWYPTARLSAPLFVAVAEQPWPSDSSAVIAALAAKAWSAEADRQDKDGSERFVASVPSRHGARAPGSTERGFEPTLAKHGQLLFFSPERRNVDAALDVAKKRAPSIGDVAALQGPTWALLSPAHLARLARTEIQEVLPADEESYFREVARNRLWPRLEAWGKAQPASALVPGAKGSDGYTRLDLQPVGASKGAQQP